MEKQSPEGKWLGQETNYPTSYNPNFLLAIPRSLNREHLGIQEAELPFVGFDVWHAYEFGCITEKGLPVNALLKLVYPANSPNLVESKSLKLYLNSFNMHRLGKTVKEALAAAQELIVNDLTKCLGVKPDLHLFTENTASTLAFDLADYPRIDFEPFLEEMEFVDFAENPELLKIDEHQESVLQFQSSLLRSNCKITAQPDWGTIYIRMEGKQLPGLKAMAAYLVSFRDEKHFHEEIVEAIYSRLWTGFSPTSLMVCAVYTRRGGIDITPVRASHSTLFPLSLKNPEKLTDKLFRQ